MSAAGRTLWNFFIAQNFATFLESATIVTQESLAQSRIWLKILNNSDVDQTTPIQSDGTIEA